MNQPAPYDFTVSPYGRTAKPSARSVLQPLLWLVAAVLAVVGPFLDLYDLKLDGSVSFGTTDANGSVASEVISTSGWGHVSGTSMGSGPDYYGGDGPKFGILFCVAAVLMAITAIWLFTNARSRYLSPTAPGLFGAALLVGSLAMFVVIYYGEIMGADLAHLYLRAGFYLEIAAVVLSLIGGLGYRISQFRNDDPDRTVDGPLMP